MPADSAPHAAEADPRVQAVTRFADACAADDAIVAAFLGGSFANGTADRYSDLDLYAITEDADYQSLLDRRYAFVKRWIEPVLLETTLDFEGFGFDMVHFVGTDGVSGELALAHRSNYPAMHGGPYRLLVDKQGLLDGVVFEGAPPDPEAARESAEHALHWFWLNGISLSKSLARGRELDAALALGRMRDACVKLIGASGRPLGPDDRQDLSDSFVGTSASALEAAARRLTRLHRRLGALVEANLGTPYPEAAAAVVEAKLAALSGDAA
jgi:Nucleotidyltransferase domain